MARWLAVAGVQALGCTPQGKSRRAVGAKDHGQPLVHLGSLRHFAGECSLAGLCDSRLLTMNSRLLRGRCEGCWGALLGKLVKCIF